MTISRVVIFGTSGHAKVVASIIETMPEYELVGFVGESGSNGKTVLSYKIIGDDSCLNELMEQYDFMSGVVGIGDNQRRKEVVNRIKKNVPQFDFVNCIHASANISKHSQFGVGNVIMPGVTINPSTVIANHCVLNTNSSIDHDSLMDNFSCLAPNSVVGGGSSIGELSQVGIGASIFHGISIGSNCVIGGGSLVNKDIEDNSVYFGIPAKFKSKRKLGEKLN